MSQTCQFRIVHCSELLNYLIGTGSNDGGEVGLPWDPRWGANLPGPRLLLECRRRSE